MMYRKYKLSHFMMLALLAYAGLIAFAVYGWRTNSNANIYDTNGEDISSPYYNSDKSAIHNEKYDETERPDQSPKGGETDKSSKDEHPEESK